MDENKSNRDYGDFFKDSNERAENKENTESAEYPRKPEGNSSYYYTYGPNQYSEQARNHSTTFSTDDYGANAEVEIKQPRPLQPIGISDPLNRGTNGGATWAYPKRKRSSFRSGFAMFLVGVLVMGGLMFASDRMNLFSGGEHPEASAPVSASGGSAVSSSGNSGGVRDASLDIVRPNNISDIVQQASPAVVKITTYAKQTRQQMSPFMDDPFFRQFFGNNFGDGDGGQQPDNNSGQEQELGMGSGFFFDKSGYILTNDHVVDGADQVKVTVEGYDEPFTAKVLGTSYDYDLAVLKIDGSKDFSTLSIGNANDVNLGDWLIAIGNPYGFDHTVTVGVLSAKERSIDIAGENGESARHYQHLLQTDASINPGNSGGPLIDLNGDVVGINTAVSTQAQGIGFAIPTGTITDILDQLKSNQNVNIPHPYIGVEIQDIQKNWVQSLKLDNTDGAIVRSVVQGSPADEAGLQPYDVITAVDDTKVKDSQALTDTVGKHKVGDRITLTVVRNGQTLKVGVTVGDSNPGK